MRAISYVEALGDAWHTWEHTGRELFLRRTAPPAESTGLLGRDCHVAHGVYLNEAGRRTLRETETSVALCPRSNATIGLGDAPIAAYLEEGSPIAIGTDSRSSSPSLDLLADAASPYSIAREHGYDREDLAERLLAAATVGGAKAMGMHHPDGVVGVLEPGRAADFAVFDVQPDLGSSVEALVTSGAGRCIATRIAGQVRFDADSG